MANRFDGALQRQAAPVPAGAPGVLDQAVFLHLQGVLGFDVLHRQVGGIGDVHLHAVLAILPGSGARAAAVGLQVKIGPAGAGIDAREDGRGAGAVAGADGHLRQGGSEGSDHRVDDPLGGLHAVGDGGGEGAIDQRIFLSHDIEGVEDP